MLEQIKQAAYNTAIADNKTNDEAQLAVGMAVVGYWTDRIVNCTDNDEKGELIKEAISYSEGCGEYTPIVSENENE